MPAYAVTVVEPSGRRRSMVDRAADPGQLRARLRERNLWPIRIRPAAPDRKMARLVLRPREFVALLNQLELQLRAGVNADLALTRLAADAPPGRTRTMLGEIEREVRAGRPIHECCRLFPRQFPPHVAAIIAAGEASAQLPAALRSLSRHAAEMDELRRVARRALIYPAAVLAAVTVLSVFLLGGVIPQFAEIFSSLHLELPAPTVFLIQVSERVRKNWALLAGGTAAAGLLGWFMVRLPRGRSFGDAAILKLPLVGDIVRHLGTARFAANVGLLHGAGVPLLAALDTGAELTGHAVLARQVRDARRAVAAGEPVSAALSRGRGFPEWIFPALRAGETSGQLGEALRHIENHAAAVARERLLTALACLEPALVALLTTVVGFIALSFFLPLFQLLGGLNPR